MLKLVEFEIGDLFLHINSGEWSVLSKKLSETEYEVYRNKRPIQCTPAGIMQSIFRMTKEEKEYLLDFIKKDLNSLK